MKSFAFVIGFAQYQGLLYFLGSGVEQRRFPL
jgi:hypothetical protein